jgi:hypothetical protein
MLAMKSAGPRSTEPAQILTFMKVIPSPIPSVNGEHFGDSVRSSRIESILALTGPAVLLPLPSGAKRPNFTGWQHTSETQMRDPEYLVRLNNGGNVGVLLGKPSNGLCSIDLDGDDWVNLFLEANPKLRGTLRTKRLRGCNLWVRIRGEYPPLKKLIHPRMKGPRGAPLDVGEWRSTGGQTVIAGEVGGLPYRVELERPAIEMQFKEIVWPEFIANPPTLDEAKTKRAKPLTISAPSCDNYPGDGLDFAKLENIKHLAGGAIRTACPACREQGGDSTGEHLHIRAGGKYGCAKFQGDGEHRRAIWRLAGKYDTRIFILPNDHTPFSEAARNIFAEIAPTHTLFVRNRSIVELVRTSDGCLLELIKPESFRSRLERYGRKLVAWKIEDGGGKVMKPKRCSEDNARALLATSEARDILPTIRTVAAAPVIVPDGDGVKVLGPGYHLENGGMLIAGGELPLDVSVEEAVPLLLATLDEFVFQCPGDRARAFAALLTPALKMGGFIRGFIPVDVREADQPQTGKGFSLDVVRSIYRESAYPIALKSGGVGSLDESISAALISGKPFIAIDNVRGRLDSQFLEMILTWGDAVTARIPHKGEVLVDLGATSFQLTSNGIEATPDFAKRASIARLLKQPPGFAFKKYLEGNLRDHIVANQPRYLGAIFSLIGDWCRRGRPTMNVTGHDFREWAGILDWFTFNHIGKHLLTGHEQAQERTANPALSWLRAVGLLVIKAGKGGREMPAAEVYEISADEQLPIPGMRQTDDRQGPQVVGRVLAKCFRNGNCIEVDHLIIERVTRDHYDPVSRKTEPRKAYTFTSDSAGRAGRC